MKKTILLGILLILSISLVVSAQKSVTSNTKTYYVVTSTDSASDTGDEVCAQAGKTCIGYTDFTTGACKAAHPNAQVTSDMNGDKSGVYCNGAPQTGICAGKTDTCHLCPACSVGVDCSTPIGGLYREMYVECSGGECPVNTNSQNVNEFFNEIPALSAKLKKCPMGLHSAVASLVGNGDVRIDILMKDGTTKTFYVTIKNKQVTDIKTSSSGYNYVVTTDEDSANAMLQTNNKFGTFSWLYKNKKITIKGNTFFSKIKIFFVKPVLGFVANKNQVQFVQIQQATIGPYPSQYACEFYQLPWPGVNKKLVSCPEETPGAAVNVADDAFCQTAMGSLKASAAVCSKGLIVCVHPCPTSQFEIMPKTCAFDNDRKRGNQAPPISSCTPVSPPANQNSGKPPKDCLETFPPGHNGYAQNKALWDSYTAKTKGVCQSQYGKGVPTGCTYMVQLSVGGNPYYICWYD